jgi:hypothetical protein
MRRIGIVSVMGRRYDVCVGETSDPDHMGECYVDDGRIIINPGYDRKFHTICHEVGHVMWNEVGFGQLRGIAILEEVFCQIFAAFMEENFDKLAGLKDKLDK